MEWLTELSIVSVQFVAGNLDKSLISFGLFLDAVGALMLAWTLFIDKEGAFERTAPRWSHPPGDERNYQTPAVLAVLRDSSRAKWGAILLVVGFSLQGCGVWM